MFLLSLLLMMSSVALATGVFVTLARPDVTIAFALRLFGLGDDWFQDHITQEELERLRKVVRLGSYVGLLAVFGWSFVVGSMLSFARM